MTMLRRKMPRRRNEGSHWNRMTVILGVWDGTHTLINHLLLNYTLFDAHIQIGFTLTVAGDLYIDQNEGKCVKAESCIYIPFTLQILHCRQDCRHKEYVTRKSRSNCISFMYIYRLSYFVLMCFNFFGLYKKLFA